MRSFLSVLPVGAARECEKAGPVAFKFDDEVRAQHRHALAAAAAAAGRARDAEEGQVQLPQVHLEA